MDRVDITSIGGERHCKINGVEVYPTKIRMKVDGNGIPFVELELPVEINVNLDDAKIKANVVSLEEEKLDTDVTVTIEDEGEPIILPSPGS